MHPWTRTALCSLNRTVGRWLPPATFSREVPGIPGRVHVDDQMYRSDAPEHVRHYVDDAQSAMENIEQSLQRVDAAGPASPSRRDSSAASTPPSAPGAAPLRGDRP